MKAARPSITSFVIVAVLFMLIFDPAMRALVDQSGEEPLYDRYAWLSKTMVGVPVLLWAYRCFGVGQRLRERGHVR